MARLFFALWPGAEAGRSLATVAAALGELAGGKPVPQDKIHLTLAFLGEVEPGRADAARRAASRIRARAFAFHLDVVGSFRAAAVAWAGCSRPVKELEGLQARLAERLRAAGFALEERPFAPHVTLARRIARPVPRAPVAAIEWYAAELTLVRTEPGSGRYTIMEGWPLRGTAEPSR